MKRSGFVVLMFALATMAAEAQDAMPSQPSAAQGAAPSESAPQQETTAQATAAGLATRGKLLVSANGARIGTVYRVAPDGSAQLILEGKMVTVPATTLSMVDGKLTTSLSKNQIMSLH